MFEMTATLPARSDRKVYIAWMAAIWVAILVGFGTDFTRYLGETPAPPLILHLHGALSVVWLTMVSILIFLVESGNVRLHMRLGWATAFLSAAMVPSSLVAAMVDQVRQVGHEDYAPQFLSLEFEEMIAFTTFVAAGLLMRKKLAEHKRFMILAAVSISDAGFARIWLNEIKWAPPGPFGWWLQYFWGIALILIAMLAWDWFVHKRVMRSVLLGALLLWTGEIAATVLFFNPGWQAAMRSLVKAWGYAG